MSNAEPYPYQTRRRPDAHSRSRIETDRPERYLAQICKHAPAMGGGGHQARMHGGGHSEREVPDVHAEWSDTQGAVTFTPGGACALTANGTSLRLRIEATDEESLRRIQDILTKDLDRFGRRDGLVVNWLDAQAQEAPADGTVLPFDDRSFTKESNLTGEPRHRSARSPKLGCHWHVARLDRQPVWQRGAARMSASRSILLPWRTTCTWPTGSARASRASRA
jgi:hypothetical protein